MVVLLEQNVSTGDAWVWRWGEQWSKKQGAGAFGRAVWVGKHRTFKIKK